MIYKQENSNQSKIEDRVWLGANIVVMKGVTIGKISIIGTNSVETKNIPSNVVVAGNTDRVIRELSEQVILFLELV